MAARWTRGDEKNILKILKPVSSRTAIHQSTMDDGAIRSELTIRQLEKGDCGRGIVTAQNIHGHVSCQFSILLAPNEEPTPITDFRSQLKNKVVLTKFSKNKQSHD